MKLHVGTCCGNVHDASDFMMCLLYGDDLNGSPVATLHHTSSGFVTIAMARSSP